MKPYFCGWYFKCQSPQQTLAVIPSIHRTPEGTRCWLQLITRKGAWHVPLPAESFRWSDHPLDVTAGGNHFSSTGLSLAVEQPDCQAHGSLSFGPLTPLRYDIMGPFRYVPGQEYRMASYLGARAVQTEQGKVVIRQGATELTARLLEQPAHSLLAPDQGAMRRRIRESVCCRAAYQLTRHGRTELDFTSGCASFEYEYPR